MASEVKRPRPRGLERTANSLASLVVGTAGTARSTRYRFPGGFPNCWAERGVLIALPFQLVRRWSEDTMNGPQRLYQPGDLDVPVSLPESIVRIARQNLVDLTPWHVLPSERAVKRLRSMR